MKQVAKFFRRISCRPSGCWEWTGYIMPNGYAQMRFEGRKQYVHRISWQIHFGEIPTGLHVCHKCDNRKCANPAHLFVGTHADNMQDAVKKGRNKTPGAQRGETNCKAKLNAAQVLSIRNDVRPNKIIAKEFGLLASYVWAIKTRKTWKHI